MRLSKKTVILGLGNILLKDEGIGVQVIKELNKEPLGENVEVIDAGVAGIDSLFSLKGTGKLIVIDAVKKGNKPGTLYRLGKEDLLSEMDNKELSLHQISLQQSLSLADKAKMLPKQVVLIGVEPKDIDWGLELSEDLTKKIPDIIDMVVKEIPSLKCFTPN